MSEVATISRITETRKHDEARTPVDIVHLDYDGRLYAWETPRGTYTEGQQVSVNPPASLGGNITPAS